MEDVYEEQHIFQTYEACLEFADKYQLGEDDDSADIYINEMYLIHDEYISLKSNLYREITR